MLKMFAAKSLASVIYKYEWSCSSGGLYTYSRGL